MTFVHIRVMVAHLGSGQNETLRFYSTTPKQDFPIDFGFGRPFMELELVIQEELNDLLDLIRNGPKFDHEKPYCKKSVQKRKQSEMDEVVAAGRLSTLEDRQFMTYTEAVIREILRIEALVLSSVPHKTLVDTELMGYKIPKLNF
uniref:Cytochrome P450 n=1 Tax=Glossina austeni TaxID=7395 RepID=A0A1A9US54_GLOAU